MWKDGDDYIESPVRFSFLFMYTVRLNSYLLWVIYDIIYFFYSNKNEIPERWFERDR